MAKLTVIGKSLLYPMFVFNVLVLLGGVIILATSTYFLGASASYVSPLRSPNLSPTWLVVTGLLTLFTSIVGQLTRLFHGRVSMTIYIVFVVISAGLLFWQQFVMIGVAEDDEVFTKNTVKLFNETQSRAGSGPTLLQKEIQIHFQCCGLDSGVQYCKNPKFLEKKLKEEVAHNAHLGGAEHISRFNWDDLEREFSKPYCGFPVIDNSLVKDDKLAWCPVDMERDVMDHGCRDPIERHYRGILKKFILSVWGILCVESITLIMAVIVLVLGGGKLHQPADYNNNDYTAGMTEM